MKLSPDQLTNLLAIAESRSPGRYQGTFNYRTPNVTIALITMAQEQHEGLRRLVQDYSAIVCGPEVATCDCSMGQAWRYLYGPVH